MAVMTGEEAYAIFLKEAIMDDGMVIREEQDALEEHLAAQGHIFTPPAELLGRIEHYAKEHGDQLLSVAASCLPEALHEPTLKAIAQMMMSDEDFAPGEAVFLHEACRCLGIDEQKANELLEQ